ncbi:uncharacterized protein PRCAT00003671001 [Priceomyces carsonii]|uniref:uncharacterized protein n=1 Tax=Priceomyces carsonii TaxID=28549 RepID=UPI002EDABAB6|nr:unnamed protein product [Priceomyces carsonii]
MGRRKIEIEPLTDDRNRTVTFVKRKAGLFKKAYELAVLCQVDIAVIIVGNNNKVYEFSSVDTDELINVYKGVKSPHESKSPENYGNYKKKRHLNENNSRGIIHDDISINDDDNDSEFESDTPDQKKQKRSSEENERSYFESSEKSETDSNKQPRKTSMNNMPSFNLPFKPSRQNDDRNGFLSNSNADDSKGSLSQRPILRVQIPVDAKSNNNDSAKTLTALDSNLQNYSEQHPRSSDSADSASNNATTNSSQGPNLSSTKFGSLRKPITTLPLPINSKSQTSSPSSPSAPQLPASGISSFLNSIPQGIQSQYLSNSILPTPIMNQVFTQQYGGPHSASQSGAGENTASGAQAGLSNNTASQANTAPNKAKSSAIMSNQFNNGEQTPLSGLPSRYVNDIFPSPSNFYAPQEWSNAATGMTPIHNNPPHYFMPMMPNGPPPPHMASRHSQFTQLTQFGHNGHGKPDGLPSPLQFMGPFSSSLNHSTANSQQMNSEIGQNKKR